jgi:hypothetical protein
MRFRSFRGFLGTIAVCTWVIASAAAAQEMKPAANVLLPYFELQLPGDGDGTSVDTTVGIANASAIATPVEITVYTNWGIPVLTFSDTLRRAQPRAIDLQQWIGRGELPDRTLSETERAELHAALTGRASPTDHLYRGTAADDGLAVGYVIARVTGEKRDVLWGDTYGIETSRDSLRGDTLATLGDDLQAECSRHAVRFTNRDAFYEGTELIVWTGRAFEPSPTPEPVGAKVKVTGAIYDDDGNHVADCVREAVAVQVIEPCSVPTLPSSGWIDVALDQPAFVQQHLHAVTAASAEFHAWCLPEDLSLKDDATGAISLNKYLDHHDADRSPGVFVMAGDLLRFTYSVWNSGALPLTNIVVKDSEGLEVDCPADTLQPGRWMDCTTSPVKARACKQRTSATVTARTAAGQEVTDSDPAWYHAAPGQIFWKMEAAINGMPASHMPGPELAEGESSTYTLTITNIGTAALQNIRLEAMTGRW